MTASPSIFPTLLAAISVFRALRPGIDAPTIAAFCAIAAERDRPIAMSAVRQAAGLSPQSASRHIALLTLRAQRGALGLGLVQSYENPSNRRCKYVRLTVKGKKVADDISDLSKRNEHVDPKRLSGRRRK